MTRWIAGLVVAVFAGGCATHSFTIPAEEVARLVEAPVEERGEAVRVIQRIGFAKDPPRVESYGPDYWAPYHGHYGHSHVYIGVYTPIYAPVPRPWHVPRAPAMSPFSEATMAQMGQHADQGIAAVAAASAVTVGLVFTEGLRYDGWVHIAHDHPVHIEQPYGGWDAVPLAALTDEHLAGGGRVVLRDDEGAGLGLRGRAPLDRRGLAWRMELGAAPLVLADGLAGSPMTTAQLGWFPAQRLGVLASASFGMRPVPGGKALGVRWGGELQALPLQIQRLHLGGYGFGGWSFDESAGHGIAPIQRRDYLLSAGGLAEIDLTTRMALSLRLGPTWHQLDGNFEQTGLQGGVGITIY